MGNCIILKSLFRNPLAEPSRQRILAKGKPAPSLSRPDVAEVVVHSQKNYNEENYGTRAVRKQPGHGCLYRSWYVAEYLPGSPPLCSKIRPRTSVRAECISLIYVSVGSNGEILR